MISVTFIFLFSFFLSIISPSLGAKGIDASSAVTAEAIQCLKNDGYTFAIARVWTSTGEFDDDSVATLTNAKQAALEAEGYIFPCFTCGNPKQQIQTLLEQLDSKAVPYGRLWVDVEGLQEYWGSDTAQNVQFIQDMVDELKAHSKDIGIYTSKSQFDPITGGSDKFSSSPLWYAHYDSDPSFNDYGGENGFGGWNTPTMKQYEGTTNVCGASADLNWKP